MRTRHIAHLLVLSTCAIGCSGDGGKGTTGGNGGATAPSSGGQATSSSSNGGSRMGTGDSAGATAKGGTSAVSSAHGGTLAEAGATAKGGASTVAGATAKGGSSAGSSANGGASAAGGGSTVAVASGCGLSGATTGAQNLTIQVAAQERSYVLSVPASYNANSALPLVFAWHGLGGSGTLARQYFGVERASANSAIFVYPTGLADSSGKAAWTLTKDGVDVQLFDALRADVAAKYCVDLARVYSTGHSYGALMTNALGCYRSNVLRGIAPVAGMPPFGRPTCTGAVAAWIAHGDNDATVDFTTGGVASRDLWIGLNGCSTTIAPEVTDPSPCVAYQGCSSGHPVNWCVHQDDHNWPSFAGAGIWAFFNSLK